MGYNLTFGGLFFSPKHDVSANENTACWAHCDGTSFRAFIVLILELYFCVLTGGIWIFMDFAYSPAVSGGVLDFCVFAGGVWKRSGFFAYSRAVSESVWIGSGSACGGFIA